MNAGSDFVLREIELLYEDKDRGASDISRASIRQSWKGYGDSAKGGIYNEYSKTGL